MTTTQPEPTVEWGSEVRVGHGGVFKGGVAPMGRWVTIEGETYLFVRGKFHRACGWCGDPNPGVKAYYGHVSNGVCFQCEGFGVTRKTWDSVEAVAKDARARARRHAREAEKRERAAAEHLAKVEAWRAENAELVDALTVIHAEHHAAWGNGTEATVERKYGRPLVSMAEDVASGMMLTVAQVGAAVDMIERSKVWAREHAAKVAAARWVGTPGSKDKVTITGEVTVWTTFESDYGYRPQTNALVVVTGTGEDEGVTAKMVGTGATLWECSRGDKVTVTGAVKDHGEYQGVKQTVLTRAKVVVVEKAPAED